MLFNTTAIVLNWNNLNVSKDSVRRLKREVPVIVVDNGSTDGSVEYFSAFDDITFINLGKNTGNCVARNKALDMVKTSYFFLLDGDILYVPDSIKYLLEVIEKNPNAGIVGVHNDNNVREFGFNGVPIESMADIKARPPMKVFKGFPMAWTQYGIFRNTGQRFIEKPPFDTAGHGYEDDWWFREMKEKELDSYFITHPHYFHDAHSGKRELAKVDLPTREEERAKAYHDKWGDSWLSRNFTIEEV